jgi:Lar family restriction alleviation protein
MEIKPCPFCKSDDVDLSSCGGFKDGDEYWVMCMNCLAEGPVARSEEEAVLPWNKISDRMYSN